MALEIKNHEIIGEIDNLEAKLNGKIPINRLELLYLVNSWGRNQKFSTNENIIIPKCEATQCYNLSKLDTSEITDMSQLFQFSMFNDLHSTNGIGLHNGDISNWDVSNVTTMEWMFFNAEYFNGDISNWDVSNVTNMCGMFTSSENFNSPIGNWDVSKVTNMDWMFYNTTNFNQALNNWVVSNVTDMRAMFCLASNFDQPLNDWDVSNVTDMCEMFHNASNFNQALNNWNVSNVTNMSRIFSGAKNFNQAILWDLSNVEAAFDVFYDAIAFETKFNNGNPLPYDNNELKQWLKENIDSDRMLAIEVKEREKDNLDNYYSNLNNLKIEEIE